MSHLFFCAQKRRFGGFARRGIELSILCWIAVGSLHPIFAQLPDDDLARQSYQTAWVGLGVGLSAISEGVSGDTDQSGGVGGAMYGSYKTGPHLISARLSAATEIFGDAVVDFGVLYGRAVEAEHGFASVAAGIAGVNGFFDDDGPQLFCGLFSDCEIERPKEFTIVGLPLEAQLMWRPMQYVGLGIYAFANLNAKASFAGASLSLQLGRLR